jgi:uncharacterized protein (TIGR02996 family)
MTDEAGFLQKIIENPDDDAPRLVFADWLEEHGDSDRAEFVRVQCELAKLARRQELLRREQQLRRREQQLLRRNKKKWAGPFSQVEAVQYRRGFIEQFVLAGATSQLLEALFQAAPVRELRIIGYEVAMSCYFIDRESIADLTACRHLSRLTSLELNAMCEPGTLELLLASPQLANLTSLSLNVGTLEDSAARALATSPHLTGLTSLSLPLNRFGALALATSPLLTGLKSLRLELDGSSVPPVVLLASPHLANLIYLGLEGGIIGNDAARILATSPHLTRLTFLSLVGTSIGLGEARVLADSPHFTHLKKIYLGETSTRYAPDVVGILRKRFGKVVVLKYSRLEEMEKMRVKDLSGAD